MKLSELEGLSQILASAVGEIIKDALAEQKKALELDFSQQITDLRKEFTACIPSAPDLSGLATRAFAEQCATENRLTIEQVKEIVKSDAEQFKNDVMETLNKIPVPQDGAPGADGKSVEISDILPVLDTLISEKLADIPAPEVPDVAALVNTAVESAVAEIPVPQDGKSINFDDVKNYLDEQVIAKFAELPAPVVPDFSQLVHDAVARSFAEIPRPADGKSVELNDVLPSINAEIERKFAEIPVPKDGNPGMDALDIMILPSIDFSKSYPRGVYASHNGGIWKTHNQTEGERGWDCVVRGCSDFTVEQRNERNFVVVQTDTMGNKKEASLKIPAMIYRNIWREGNTYEHGDTVTWGGSLWHCNKSTDSKPGDGQECWTLAAKKGRDAK